MVKKGKATVSTKVRDMVLWKEYQKTIGKKFTDLQITEAWLRDGRTLDDVFDRWIRLDKSPKQAAKNLVAYGTTPGQLYNVLRNRNMNLREMRPIWQYVGMSDSQLRTIRLKLQG
ncbi:hypothetical protein F441_10384 [Phytophthora nicotianae CJ01A1]|uniref:RxLR effector protein n=4 Tax=Phytophthora nicotianae TaxID=4792 RepID=W2Z993_PHYNI|nr:hypothetical protein L915_10203 [Phytophthora nicotianae]ETO73513.1 hypothetical protein F444_10539 [Phytophthora nicotianae P1976]ETP14692.1 hypothetical protein F441_10384 [Phytophthora nicotianae CJ01A1]ETP42764.1 hypothetical protein F442_10347 [Phytophthora nicotianae P10297]ETL38293.1 hypothetical protein L916_10109 [Phytophthora nicotianae]